MAAETMVTVLAATLLGTGWLLWLLPVGTCAQCAHCRAEKLAHERESEAQLGQAYGVPMCTACGRYHRRGDDHRP